MKHFIQQFITCLVLGVMFSSTAWAADVTVDAKNGDIIQYNEQTVNITIENRTYQPNNWVVVCYPFNVTKALLDEAFPQGYAVEEYSSMSADGKFTFTVLDLSANNIPAGTPFLLKSKVEVSSVTFNNVTINTTLHNVTKTNGNYSGTLNGTYSRPGMYQFNSGQPLAGGLFISSSGTLVGPYSSPLNDDTETLRITNGYFSFSEGVSSMLNIEPATIGGGNSGGNNTDNPSTGEGGDTGGGSDNTPTNTGFTDLGHENKYGYECYSYSYKGTSAKMVKDAVITITTSADHVDCYINSSCTGEKWKTQNSFTLTEENVTELAATDYTFWMEAWEGPVTNVTITVPGGGGTTTDPDDDETPGTGGQGGSVDPSSMAYKIAHKQQLSDVPTIYLTIPDVVNLDTDLTKDRQTNIALYHKSGITVVDDGSDNSAYHLTPFTEESDFLEVKVRGNSTANPSNGKKAYRLKFAKKHKHDMLGYGYEKRNWTLLANVFDHSLIRNALTYELGKKVGMPFNPGYKFVDLVINNDYRGTYQISDHCEVDVDRINVDEETGWYVEFQGRGDMLDPPMCYAERGIQMNISNPEPLDETDEAQRNAIINPVKDWFLNTWAPKWTSSDKFSASGWRSVNDEETLLKFYLILEITGDYDGLMSTKAYREADGKLMWGPIWDKDLAYGNVSDGTGYDTKLVADISNASSIRSYFAEQLLNDPAFTLRLKNTMNQLINDGLEDYLCNKIDYIANIVKNTQALNYQKYSIDSAIGYEGYYSYTEWQDYVDQLKEWVRARLTFVKEQFETKAATANTISSNELNYDPTDGTYLNFYNNVTGKLIKMTVSPRSAIKGDSWSTLILPFDATQEQMQTALGGAYNLKTFKGMNGSTFEFEDASSNNILANTPYLIKMQDASKISNTTWVFNGVIFSPASYNETLTCFNEGGYSVVGLNHPQNLDTTGLNYFLNSNGELEKPAPSYWDSSTSQTIYPNKLMGTQVYFVVPSGVVPTISFNTVVPPTPVERTQLTNLPTIYLDATVGNEWSTASVEIFDNYNKLNQGTHLVLESTSDVTALEVQYQGSGDKNKDSYRLKFGSKIKLMGAYKYKQWVLLANDDDPSMINNALAKELGDAVGMPWTPGYQFVDLYVNNTYMGTYQVTDRVKAEEGRSLVTDGNNKTDWQVRFNDDAELAEDKTTDYITATNGVNVIYKNPDPKDLTTEQLTALTGSMKTYFDEVFAKTNGTYPNFAENVDKDQLINWYICQEILGVYKGFSSIEAYRSVTATAADNLLHFGPLWDSEKAFGNHGEAAAINMSDMTTADSYLGLMTNYAAYDEMKDLFNYLWTQPWFGSGVRDKWNALKTAGLLATLKDKADAISGTLSESQPKNAEKWTESLGGSTYETAIANIKSYLGTRFEYLDTKFNARAAGLCDHTFAYADNGNGTHKHYCTKCDYTDVESEAHTLTMVSGKAKCSVCELEMTASVTGNEGEKVYILNAGKAGAQYITKTSGFTPTANTLFPINEKPEEGTVFNNVYWTENGTKYADNIIVTDGTAWLGDVKVSAKNATYQRSMSASSVWGTVCLPFKTEPNDDVTLYQLASSTADLNGNGNMVFVEAESTGGLTPLVYKKNNSSATSVSFQCSPQDDGYVTVKAADLMKNNKPGKTVTLPSGWKFYGNVEGTQTLTTTATETPALYYIASNKFWHATGTLDVTPFRAYFTYTPADGSSLAKSFSIGVTADEEVTNIASVNSGKTLAIFLDKSSISLASEKSTLVRIYSISGAIITNVSVGAGECRTLNLPSGIYIVNGTKVTVK